MDTRHLVDPELAPFLDQFPGLRLTPEILPQVRAMLPEGAYHGFNMAADARVTQAFDRDSMAALRRALGQD